MAQTTSPLERGATDRWDWPDDLDALVAAPGNHQLLLENDRVRVIRTTVAVGAITPVHTHRWPSVEYVLSATVFLRRDASGSVVFDSRTAPLHPSEALWSDPFPPHSVENIGNEELEVLMVELKGAEDARRQVPTEFRGDNQ